MLFSVTDLKKYPLIQDHSSVIFDGPNYGPLFDTGSPSFGVINPLNEKNKGYSHRNKTGF